MVKATTRVYRLDQADQPPAMTFVDVTDEPFCTVGPGGYTFCEYLDEVVQAEPAESLDPVTLGFYASIGIIKGRPFTPDDRMKAILSEAAAVGDATTRALTYRMRRADAYYYPGSAWRTAFLGGYEFSEEGRLRADRVEVAPRRDRTRVGGRSSRGHPPAIPDRHGRDGTFEDRRSSDVAAVTQGAHGIRHSSPRPLVEPASGVQREARGAIEPIMEEFGEAWASGNARTNLLAIVHLELGGGEAVPEFAPFPTNW